MKQTKQNNARGETYYNGASTFVSESDIMEMRDSFQKVRKLLPHYIYLQNKNNEQAEKIESQVTKNAQNQDFYT
jgi:hypothetical protein